MYVKVLVKKVQNGVSEFVRSEVVPLGNLNNTLFQLGQEFPKEGDEYYFIDTVSLLSPVERGNRP